MNINTIINLTAPLAAIGYLTDADVDRITGYIDRATLANTIFYNHDSQRREAIADATATVINAPDLAAAISKAAPKIPTETGAAIAEAAENAAIAAAADVLYARSTQLPTIITSEFDEVSDAALAVADDLIGITSAQDAIDHGASEAWRKISVLRDRYSALNDLRTTLRLSGLIPAPGAAAAGPAWSFKLNADVDEFYRAVHTDDNGVAVFLYDVRRRPYCAASAAEANAVLESWEPEVAA